MLEPNDFRDVLAIARAGSLNVAARKLSIDPSTMGRRLAALEAKLGIRLFRRTRSQLELTPQGTQVVQAAEQMEAQALACERELLARDASPAGDLRITASEWGVPLLTPSLGTLAHAHPGLRITLLIENRTLDLARREADVALRIGPPKEAGLVGKKLGKVTYALYGSAGYLKAHGTPADAGELAAHAFCGLEDNLAFMPHVKWQRQLARGARVAFQTNSMLSLIEAVRASTGLGVLPVMIASRYPELRRLLDDEEWVQRGLWLVYHSDLRRSARVRAAVDHLVLHVSKLVAASS